ncbi:MULTISPECIES: hypothetical protein [unclassified Microcystis]|jgi:hypothetical protein|uniref:hypothetical protein n=1 Tax=unclassified Microcystis TaxID=2643300 RepID=UPI00258F455B|nr:MULTISPECIES: hypothetical protein [unclassified Microcystis]MCA2818249.1 hypothetical protein [Microcystis sp. M085S1]MCA2855114.1 hypothetical protein [Microcystis sp. M065S1]MCA2626592.1 hypothetical protein [Microcystis sp. M091S2]MCA2644655.1 hypothetical protein [Microcystis sp. M069S2]MCA2662097.1 hypothetical protein [Microcystis sp. M064S2]
MKITYQKVNLKAPKTETAYWRSQSYQTRLSALEEIRQEYHQYKYNAEPRLQRVYTIANAKGLPCNAFLEVLPLA